MTITSQICEQCGGPNARLLTYWPATLCQACAAERVANAKAAEAAQDVASDNVTDEPPTAAETPQATTEEPIPHPLAAGGRDPFMDALDEMLAAKAVTPSARRRALRAGNRELALAWIASNQETLPLQIGLAKRLVAAGDHIAAKRQALALFDSFVHGLYAAQTGVVAPMPPVDICLSKLRLANVITVSEMILLLGTWHDLESSADEDGPGVSTAASAALSALARVVLLKVDIRFSKRRFLGRSLKRGANRALKAFHGEPAEIDAEPESELEIGWPEAEATEGASTQAAEVTA